jgi:hypothetical protein
VNKYQVILPLAAILAVALVATIVHGRNQARGFVQAKTREIGQDLIRLTNSQHVIELGHTLEAQLAAFLGSPTRIAAVLRGDEDSPIGDDTASSRLYLENERQQRLIIRLRKDSASEEFHILGFWTPDKTGK